MIDDPIYQAGDIVVREASHDLIFEQQFRRNWRTLPFLLLSLGILLISIIVVLLFSETILDDLLVLGTMTLFVCIGTIQYLPEMMQMIFSPSSRITITDQHIKSQLIWYKPLLTKKWQWSPNDTVRLATLVGSDDIEHPEWVRGQDMDEINRYLALYVARDDERFFLLAGYADEMKELATRLTTFKSRHSQNPLPEIIQDDQGLTELTDHISSPLINNPPDCRGFSITEDKARNAITISYKPRGWLHSDTLAAFLAIFIFPASALIIGLIIHEGTFTDLKQSIAGLLFFLVPGLIAVSLAILTIDRATYHQSLSITSSKIMLHRKWLPWPTRVSIDKSDVSQIIFNQHRHCIYFTGIKSPTLRDRLSIVSRFGFRKRQHALFIGDDNEVPYFVWLLLRDVWDNQPSFVRTDF